MCKSHSLVVSFSFIINRLMTTNLYSKSISLMINNIIWRNKIHNRKYLSSFHIISVLTKKLQTQKQSFL